MRRKEIKGLPLSRAIPYPRGHRTYPLDRFGRSLERFFGEYLLGVARLDCQANLSDYISLDADMLAVMLRHIADYADEEFIPTVTLFTEDRRLYIKISDIDRYSAEALSKISAAAVAAGFIIGGSRGELALYTETFSVDTVKIYAISKTDVFTIIFKIFFQLGN